MTQYYTTSDCTVKNVFAKCLSLLSRASPRRVQHVLCCTCLCFVFVFFFQSQHTECVVLCVGENEYMHVRGVLFELCV